MNTVTTRIQYIKEVLTAKNLFKERYKRYFSGLLFIPKELFVNIPVEIWRDRLPLLDIIKYPFAIVLGIGLVIVWPFYIPVGVFISLRRKKKILKYLSALEKDGKGEESVDNHLKEYRRSKKFWLFDGVVSMLGLNKKE